MMLSEVGLLEDNKKRGVLMMLVVDLGMVVEGLLHMDKVVEELQLDKVVGVDIVVVGKVVGVDIVEVERIVEGAKPPLGELVVEELHMDMVVGVGMAVEEVGMVVEEVDMVVEEGEQKSRSREDQGATSAEVSGERRIKKKRQNREKRKENFLKFFLDVGFF